jgi:hypothetical protein
MKKNNSGHIKIISVLFMLATATAANAECVSNGTNLTEDGSWCANMNNENYCNNYSGCEWFGDDDSISPIPAANASKGTESREP